MSYTARAYRETAKILKDQVTTIMSEPLTPGERMIAVETVNNIATGLVEIFLKDNPRGFSATAFYTNAGLGPGSFSKISH